MDLHLNQKVRKQGTIWVARITAAWLPASAKRSDETELWLEWRAEGDSLRGYNATQPIPSEFHMLAELTWDAAGQEWVLP